MKPDYGNVRAVLLDAGNTFMGMDHDYIARGITSLGLPCSATDLARAEARSRPQLSRYLAGDRSTEDHDTRTVWIRMILDILLGSDAARTWVQPVGEWVSRADTWDRIWKIVLPGAPEALERMSSRGLQLVTVSNSDGRVADRLREGGLFDYFDHVVDSFVVGYEKPDPRIFQHALQLTGVPKEQALHMGDMYSVDVIGARAAGIPGVLVDPHLDYEDLDCDVFRDMAALADRLALGG